MSLGLDLGSPVILTAAHRRGASAEGNRDMVASDIEIARAARMRPIHEIGDRLGLDVAALQPYGHTKAKVDVAGIAGLDARPDGKLILVTAMTPTPAGDG